MLKTIMTMLAGAKVAAYTAAAAMAGPPGPPRRRRSRTSGLINVPRRDWAGIDRYSRKERDTWPIR